jgi:hypothetical protein
VTFKKGQKAHPNAGFASNQRALYKKFYRDAKKAWDERGPKALEEMAEKNPVQFCQMFASMMPKSYDITQELHVDERKTITLEVALKELQQLSQRLEGINLNQLPHNTRVIEHDKTNAVETGDDREGDIKDQE